jgi:hypothetical protein
VVVPFLVALAVPSVEQVDQQLVVLPWVVDQPLAV